MRNSKDNHCFVYFAVLATSLAALATGSCYVWSSPFLPKFQSAEPGINPIGHPVTTSESAWIVSSLSLGFIIGPSVSIVFQKFFTKKIVLLITVTPILVAHIICCFASEVNVFILARLLMGIGTGSVWAVLGIYIAEISEDKNRGILGSLPVIMSNLGVLFVYIIGPYSNMRMFSIYNVIPLVLFYLVFGIFVPDSPYDLIKNGKYKEAESSLKKLRPVTKVEKEMTFIKGIVNCGNNEDIRFYNLIKDPIFRRGFLLCNTLMMFQQVPGNVAVLSYAELIFKLGGDFIPSSFSAMALGVVAIVGIVISLFLVDKMGRKILLASSCILGTISLFAIGLYFYLLNSGFDVSKISWVPVTSLMVFIIGYNLALCSVPWIMMGEVFHSNVKTLASTITAIMNFAWNFSVSICFPYLVEYIGLGWTFWMFSLIMMAATIFCIFVLPETKGKNFQEIQDILKKSKSKQERYR